jgi:hypothetical protein
MKKIMTIGAFFCFILTIAGSAFATTWNINLPENSPVSLHEAQTADDMSSCMVSGVCLTVDTATNLKNILLAGADYLRICKQVGDYQYNCNNDSQAYNGCTVANLGDVTNKTVNIFEDAAQQIECSVS